MHPTHFEIAIQFSPPLIFCSFVTMFKGTIRIACKLGTLMRIGRFQMLFNSSVDVSQDLWLPNPSNPTELVKQSSAK